MFNLLVFVCSISVHECLVSRTLYATQESCQYSLERSQALTEERNAEGFRYVYVCQEVSEVEVL